MTNLRELADCARITDQIFYGTLLIFGDRNVTIGPDPDDRRLQRQILDREN